jgi:hypothetical protein
MVSKGTTFLFLSSPIFSLLLLDSSNPNPFEQGAQAKNVCFVLALKSVALSIWFVFLSHNVIFA